MNTRLFRKASLERLSSPEELDQVITISVGGGWAALLAILILCGAATVWAVTGSLPTTARGSGMIVSTGGVLNVVSRGAGIVSAIDVAVGQHVDANQVVARIDQPALVERVQRMREELAQVSRKQAQDVAFKNEESRIRFDALVRQRANIERSITELRDQARLAAERIPVTEQLFARGLVTNQQVIAARLRLVELNGQVDERAAQLKQLDAQEFELKTQTATLEASTRLDVANRERQIAAAAAELSLQETVTAPAAGRVVEVKVSAGGTVAAGVPIISLQPDADTIEALAYVSSLQAKDVRVGMQARVSPSTVKREEHGYMRAKVLFVADYPATAAAVMRSFQNEQLVQAMTAGGPITEVRVTLERDPGTVSGFRWSSPGGPPVRISAGTIVSAEIVTQSRAPITLVIPFLRQKVGL